MDDSYRTLFSAFTCEFHFLNKSFKNRLFELKDSEISSFMSDFRMQKYL